MKNVLKNIANTPGVEVFPLRPRKVDTIIVTVGWAAIDALMMVIWKAVGANDNPIFQFASF